MLSERELQGGKALSADAKVDIGVAVEVSKAGSEWSMVVPVPVQMLVVVLLTLLLGF